MVVVVEKGEVNRRSGLKLSSEGTITCACRRHSIQAEPKSRTSCQSSIASLSEFYFSLFHLTLCVLATTEVAFAPLNIVPGGGIHKSSAHQSLTRDSDPQKLCGAPSL